MFEAREIKENDIIRAKALRDEEGKANLPHGFVTNDDFCPLRPRAESLQGDKVSLRRHVRDDLADSADPANARRREARVVRVSRAVARSLAGGGSTPLHRGAARRDQDDHERSLQYAYVHGVEDVEKPAPIKVAIRGNPFKPGDEVSRHFPSVLVDGDPVPFTKGSGRHELADAIAQEPLAMRVIVNRVWKWHFGTGLVNSASNFGKIGDPPSNPELLEHLAAWFVENGHSIKKLQRQILLSAAYQSSADDSPAAFAKDSGNRWYWRANRRRMTAEEVRDSALFVAGALDEKMGGPSEELTPSATRRTLYARISRYKLVSFLQLFDFPAPTISAEQRFSTNVPLQRLFLMNSDFMQQQAERLARKLETEADNSSRIKKAYRTLFGREPKPEELTAGLEYLAAEPLRAYEERKAAEAKKTDAEKAKEAKAAKAAKEQPKMGEGMMAGVTAPGGAGADAKDKKEMLPVTPLGRYLKVLLSSSEFLFVD